MLTFKSTTCTALVLFGSLLGSGCKVPDSVTSLVIDENAQTDTSARGAPSTDSSIVIAPQPDTPATVSDPMPEPVPAEPVSTPSNLPIQPSESSWPAPSGPASITDLILVTGQSNALGFNTAYDPALDSPSDRVYAWTDQGWQVASLHQIWDLGWHPRTHPDADPHNNFALHFGKQLVASSPNRVVGFVLASAPGEGISHWDYGSDFYRHVSNKAVAALNDLPHKSAYDGVLWHQGETDWQIEGSSDPDQWGVSLPANYYSSKLASLIANLRSESWFGFDKPFIGGETASAPVNQVLRGLNQDSDYWTATVGGEGLPTFDEVHFNAVALREIGVQYAHTYQRLTD